MHTAPATALFLTDCFPSFAEPRSAFFTAFSQAAMAPLIWWMARSLLKIESQGDGLAGEGRQAEEQRSVRGSGLKPTEDVQGILEEIG